MIDKTLCKKQGTKLREYREMVYRSARAAAMENGWPESTYRAHERGSRTIGQDDAERYAKRFRAAGVRVTGRDILYPDESQVSPKSEIETPMKGGGLLRIEEETLRSAVNHLLRATGTDPDQADELARIFVVSLAGPPLAAVDGDPLRSFEARFEILSPKSEH